MLERVIGATRDRARRSCWDSREDRSDTAEIVDSSESTKSYADTRRRPLEFEVGDHVLLKVSPTRGVFRFGKKGKLSPRYIGPFEILDRVGDLAYRLALPPALSHVHNVFHVSQLRKYIPDPSHIIDYGDIEVSSNASYAEQPVSILERRTKQLRNKSIPLVKIQWSRHGVDEATWETEEDMRTRYPSLFWSFKFWGRNFYL